MAYPRKLEPLHIKKKEYRHAIYSHCLKGMVRIHKVPSSSDSIVIDLSAL